MNDRKLIALVREHPMLYDLSHAKYMDSDLKNALWRKIGSEMKTDWSACKTRWGNIRDNFRKSLNKQKTKVGLKGKTVKQYKYSEQLSFMEKFFERDAKPTVEVEEAGEDASSENEEYGQNDTQEITTEPLAEEFHCLNAPTPNPSELINIPRKKSKPSPNEITAKTAAAILTEYIVSKNESMFSPPPQQHPVDAFLAGIAPALKELPPQYWHYAKGEIFDTVQKYEYKNLVMTPQQFVEVDGTSASACSTPSHSPRQPSPSQPGSHQSPRIIQPGYPSSATYLGIIPKTEGST